MVHFTYGDCMVETVYTGHGNKAIANVYCQSCPLGTKLTNMLAIAKLMEYSMQIE